MKTPQQIKDLEDRLAAANNVIQCALAAIDAVSMSESGSDALSSEARKLCRGFRVRLDVYRKTGR